MESAGANGLAAGQKWVIETPIRKLAFSKSFKVETYGAERIASTLLNECRESGIRFRLSYALVFPSGATANVTSPCFLVHTSHDVSEN
jgi:hypothetical protein